MRRSPIVTIVLLMLLMLCGIGVTVASFYALILPENRGPTFHAALSSLCVAEFVLFGYLAYMVTVPLTVKWPSPAVRMRIMALVVVWFFVTLVFSIIAVHPATADTFFADKLLIWEAIISFLGLLSVFFLHWQDVNIQQRDDVPQRERTQLESYAGGISSLLNTLRRCGERHPESALQVDAALKKLDTLKTFLLSASPEAERPTERLVATVDVAQVEKQLSSVHSAFSSLEQADAKQFDLQLKSIREHVDAAVELLRRREDVLTF